MTQIETLATVLDMKQGILDESETKDNKPNKFIDVNEARGSSMSMDIGYLNKGGYQSKLANNEPDFNF